MQDINEIMQLSQETWKSLTIQCGVKLDIFTVIDNLKDGATLKEIKDKLKGSDRGLKQYLGALLAMDLITLKGHNYHLAPLSKEYLSKNSKKYVGYILLHHLQLMNSWKDLDQAVITGRPLNTVGASHTDDHERRENFLMGMFNMASKVAPSIVKVLDLKDRKSLLDLGGGPGTYALNFCKNWPNLKAAIFDLPTSRPFATKIINNFSLQDRVSFIDGDFNQDPIASAGEFDVIWASHIAHAEGEENLKKIIKKAYNALPTGGLFIIHEFVLNDNKPGPLFPALFSLNMLVGTHLGKSYSLGEFKTLLEDTGFINIEQKDLGNEMSSLILSHKN